MLKAAGLKIYLSLGVVVDELAAGSPRETNVGHVSDCWACEK
jgi:hypothetical protein